MKRWARSSIALLLAWPACAGSPSPQSNDAGPSISGTGGSGGAGSGGTSAGSGGGAGGDGSGGGRVDAGVSGVDVGGADNGATGPDVRDAATTTTGRGPFVCNHVLGLFTTSQWYFEGGFEKAVGDANWQIMWQKYSYVTLWADPNSDRWRLPVQSPCATNSDRPDRVLLVAHAEMTDQQKWETLLTQAVATIQMKYPSVSEIDILTMSRAPNNVECKNNSDPWTVVAPSVDQAIQNVADKSGGLVVAGPKYYVPDCATSYSFPNDTDFTKSADTFIAQALATYYKQHP